MHILLVHQAFTALDEPGGTRHYELACLLCERGHQVTVIASPVSYLTGRADQERALDSEQAYPAGLKVVRAYTYSALHRSFVHRVFSFVSFMISSFLAGLKVRKVDLVWGTSPPIFQGVTAWALAKLKGTPLLFEVRDLWPAFAIQVGVLRSPILISLSKWLEKFLYKRADLVMINSPGFSQHVQERGARQVALAPNGADPGMFDPQADGAAFRRSHGLPQVFVAMYAGAHGMSNDLEIVLEAARLLEKRTEIAIALVGDGKEKPALLEKAGAMGLKNVYFLPPVPKAEMGQALAAANACIAILKPIPLYATVYPNKVFDYMAAGRPVALAIDGVIRTVIEENQAGLFVQPGNAEELAEAIAWLADHPDEGREMGRRGRACVEKYYNRIDLAAKLAVLMEGLVLPGGRG